MTFSDPEKTKILTPFQAFDWILKFRVQTKESNESVWIPGNPLTTPLILEFTSFRILPVPAEKNRPPHLRFVHIRNHFFPSGPALQAIFIIWADQFQPMPFLMQLGKGLGIP